MISRANVQVVLSERNQSLEIFPCIQQVFLCEQLNIFHLNSYRNYIITNTIQLADHSLPSLSTQEKKSDKVQDFFWDLSSLFRLLSGLSIIIVALKVSSFVLFPQLCHPKLRRLSPNFLHVVFHWPAPCWYPLHHSCSYLIYLVFCVRLCPAT